MKKYLLTSCLIGLTACSFVSLDPQAQDVKVAHNSISSCKFLGTANVSLWSKATSLQSKKTVAEQLDTLARNEAAKMHGNTVVADSKINNGTRSYKVYSCVH